MMTNNKSGKTGKLKVALALFSTIAFSILIVQCNSKLDDPETLEALERPSIVSSEVVLPYMPGLDYKYQGDLSSSVDITIVGNQVWLDGEEISTVDMVEVLAKKNLTEHATIVMSVDKGQSMSLVGEVQHQLRKADRRKILYRGVTDAGGFNEMAFLLPPLPGNPNYKGKYLPKIDDKYIAEHGIDVLYIKLGKDERELNQQRVDDMVRRHMAMESSNYVVSAKFEDDDTFGEYLTNLAYIQAGFNNIYQERSQEMFGKNFFDLDKSNPEEKAQYNAVRKGIPRAISIAERD